MSVNLEAFWLLTQEVLRRGNFAKDLSVVAIGSAASAFGAKGKTAYAASKGALVSLVYSLAAEYAHQKLRFNCVCPSYVNTAMLENIRNLYSNDEKLKEFISARQPLGVGEPEDVALAVVYLLSGAAKWVTGSVFSVDGGYGLR